MEKGRIEFFVISTTGLNKIAMFKYFFRYSQIVYFLYTRMFIYETMFL